MDAYDFEWCRTAIKNSIDTADRIKIQKYMDIALPFNTGTQQDQ